MYSATASHHTMKSTMPACGGGGGRGVAPRWQGPEPEPSHPDSDSDSRIGAHPRACASTGSRKASCGTRPMVSDATSSVATASRILGYSTQVVTHRKRVTRPIAMPWPPRGEARRACGRRRGVSRGSGSGGAERRLGAGRRRTMRTGAGWSGARARYSMSFWLSVGPDGMDGSSDDELAEEELELEVPLTPASVARLCVALAAAAATAEAAEAAAAVALAAPARNAAAEGDREEATCGGSADGPLPHGPHG